MTQMIIDMPPDLQGWVETRLAYGDYVDAGEYVRDLLRKDRLGESVVDAEEDAEMRALVDEGLRSGVCEEQPEEVLRRVIAGLPRPRG